MHTARSSSGHGGVSTEQAPPGADTPLGAGTPWPDPPQLPPWVWAWTRSPSTPPLGVGLDQIPLNFPLGCGPGPDPPQLPPYVWAWRPPSPRPDPPKLPPWVWAWKPARHAGIPPPPRRPAARHAGTPPAMHAGIAPPSVNRMTDRQV